MNPHLRILICPNAFKASLTAVAAASAIAEGIQRLVSKGGGAESECRIALDLAPLADGGDGTLTTLVAATGGTIQTSTVQGPLGDAIEAEWGRLGASQPDTAIIEMARASGLGLLTPDQFDPMNSTTYGTGELMLTAAKAGCTRLLVGIGGSATNDGGAGMAQALGARLLDNHGVEIPRGGAGLAQIAKIDMDGWKLPDEVEVVAACDVDNVLAGPRGAAAVFGPQKGATPSMVRQLDANLLRYAAVVASTFGQDVSSMPGSGAAGGLGAGLRAFCDARLVPGTELVLDAVDFEARLAACDLVITGEGRLDEQTGMGKVIGVVAQRSLAVAKPCIALAGSLGGAVRLPGLTAAFSITVGPMPLEDAMRNAYALLANAAEQVVRAVLWERAERHPTS